MSEHRKVINPLLNISVTGATLEDFSQNAVLLPAAEAPPVLLPPQPPTSMIYPPLSDISLAQNQPNTTGTTSFTNNNQVNSQAVPGTNFDYYNNSPAPPPNWNPYLPQPQQQGAILQEFTIGPDQNLQQYQQFPQQPQVSIPPQPESAPQQQPQLQQATAGLQSVFSSFSSYLKLGSRQQPQEEEEIVPVPSVVDSLLGSVDPNAAVVAPVQFYSPDIFPSVGASAPLSASPASFVPSPVPIGLGTEFVTPGVTASGLSGPPVSVNQSSNTYRRGGFKRPAYAQIPGLSTGGVVPAPLLASSLPHVAPQQIQGVPPLPTNLSQGIPPIPVNLPSVPKPEEGPIPGIVPSVPLARPGSGHSPLGSFGLSGKRTPNQSPLAFQGQSVSVFTPTAAPSNIPGVPPFSGVSGVPSVPLIPVLSASPVANVLVPQIPLIPTTAVPQVPEIPQVQSIPLIPTTSLPQIPLVPLLPVKQPTPPPQLAHILHPTSLPFTPHLQSQVDQPSPFLSPVSYTEEIQLSSIPTIPNSVPTFDTTATPTILTPSSYYPATAATSSAFLNPIVDMSKPTGDSPRSSPGINTQAHANLANLRMDSTDPILTQNETAQMYRPVYHHWFYRTAHDTKIIWTPFSMMDSLNLDTAYLSPDLSPDKLVATDGGRYDVNILLRERVPVYWEGAKAEVRRCSWFHKGNTDGRFVPYEENVATKLEEEFKIAYETNTWNRRVDLANGESVVFHGPDVLVLFPQTQCPDSWGNTPNQPRPRVVKRGLDEFHIEEGESAKVDHLLFMVHGIGKFCDLKFRGVEEAVDEFRSMALQLVQSHYRSSCENEIANRIEILPISWHSKLHSDETGVDKKMEGITLESIPRLREFINDTILDVLFYTSPVYCQTIISTVGNELNRIYELYKQRNPSFQGGVSLGGHSLGSLILFDILCHQQPETEKEQSLEPETSTQDSGTNEDELSPLKPPPNVRKMSRRISYMMAQIGTGQAQISYPHLSFQPRHFFALGSPVGMFVTVRGLDNLGEQFTLPTCPEFFNIFHPYDPVAYRIESLINPELAGLKPVLIPHHKGRKRMHLELKETMARVGADLKQKLIDSMKSTWNSFYQFTLFKGQTNTQNAPSLEEEVNKVLEEQLKQDGNASDEDSIIEAEHTDLSLGQLNGGRRIDYVLQEAPLEFFNEYIFALTSHVCYWESNDTILLIVKEIYNSKNISADSQIAQPTMKIERTISMSSNDDAIHRGMDPTVPMYHNTNIGPPPTAGFVRKT